MRLARTITVASAMLLSIAWAVSPATALPFGTFNYQQAAGFIDGSETPGPDQILFDNSLGAAGAANAYADIGWGNFQTCAAPPCAISPNQSALLLDSISGTIAVGETKIITTLTHRNIDIDEPFLASVDITSILRLFIPPDSAFPDPAVLTDVNTIPITFNETDNHPVGGLAGCDPTIQQSLTPCDDYFEFPLGGFASITFQADTDGNGIPETYTLTFDIQPLGTIIPIDTDGDGIFDTGRIITEEGSTNTIDIVMTLQLVPTPVPATLLLLGLGLLGAGVVGRLRKS